MRTNQPILVETDGLYLLGLLVQRYQYSDHTEYDYMALEQVRIAIRTELKARADAYNQEQEELDRLSKCELCSAPTVEYFYEMFCTVDACKKSFQSYNS